MDAGITTTAAAATAGRTVATIRHWCRYGAVAAAKVAGRWIIETTSLTRRIQLDAKPAAKRTAPVAPIAPVVAPAPAAPVRAAAPARAAASKVSYRKTKSGEWVAYGPAATLRLGPVTVTKRDNTTKNEVINRLGKPFTVNGVAMVYGYLAPSRPASRATAGHCEECGGSGARYQRYDSSGIPGTVCSPCSRQPSYMLSFA